MKKIIKKDFVKSKDLLRMSPGVMVATLRELQGLSQMELASLVHMSSSHLSNIERGKQEITRTRVLAFSKVLKVHPAVIMFPNEMPFGGTASQRRLLRVSGLA